MQAIYQDAMSSELLKGASIPREMGGLDLLGYELEEDAESEMVTLKLLRAHVANNLYNITARELAVAYTLLPSGLPTSSCANSVA